MAIIRNWSICCCLLLLLQGQFGASKPAAERPVSPLTALPERGNANNTGVLFVDGVGDLITGLVTTGLRAASAFLQSGSEASEKIAIAVGSAAIGPLLNVSRSYNTVRKSVSGAIGGAQSVLADEKVFQGLSTRITQGVEPAMKSFAEALDLAIRNRPFRPGSATSPTGVLNILSGTPSSSSSSTSGRSNSTASSNPDDYDIPDYID